MEQKIINVVVIGLALSILVFIKWPKSPPKADHRLIEGRVACPTEDGVVRVRGGRMFGMIAEYSVIGQNQCVFSKLPLKVLRPSDHKNLVAQVELEGKVMYADHDALIKF